VNDERRGATRVATAATWCFLAAVGIVAFAALVVAATGTSDDARRALRFGFGGVDRSPAEAARIALHNLKYAAGTLTCAALIPRVGPLIRTVVDALLAALLIFNAGAVGVAIGAYGTRVVSAIAPHLPLEFAGLGLAGGAYVQARRQVISAQALAAIAAVCAALVGVAATLETYVSTAGGPR
jgi:hypothetical protein